MLTFIVSENGSIPNNSSMYESGYEITARKDVLIKPFSTFVIKSGLILKCNSYDFIYLAIDDHYLNILKIENNIIENNTNIPYDIRIINLTNDNITIEKNNKICHFYCLNKAYLHETIVKNNKSKLEDIKPETVQEVSEVVETVPEVPENVQEVPENVQEVPEEVPEVQEVPEVIETVPEEVPEVQEVPEVVETVQEVPEVVETVQEVPEVQEVQNVPENVQEVPENVQEVPEVPEVQEVHEVHENVQEVPEVQEVHEVHEVQNVQKVPEVVETVQDNLSHGENNVELSQNQINANLAKRKYIRKKKMTINIP